MQAPKGRASVVCARGRTKKEVWAERIMMDKTKDTHKIQKECERKREEYEIASVNLENPNFRPTNVRGVRGIYRGNSQSTLTGRKRVHPGLRVR